MTRRAKVLTAAIGMPGGAYAMHVLTTGTPDEVKFLGNLFLTLVMLVAAWLLILQAYHQNRRG